MDLPIAEKTLKRQIEEEKMKKTFWSGISVFSPGNFVAIHLSAIDGEYTIENKKQFLEKFFEISKKPLLTPSGLIYNSPFAMPEINFNPKYAHLEGKKFEFLIENIGRKIYRIVLDKIRFVENKYTEISV